MVEGSSNLCPNDHNSSLRPEQPSSTRRQNHTYAATSYQHSSERLLLPLYRLSSHGATLCTRAGAHLSQTGFIISAFTTRSNKISCYPTYRTIILRFSQTHEPALLGAPVQFSASLYFTWNHSSLLDVQTLIIAPVDNYCKTVMGLRTCPSTPIVPATVHAVSCHNSKRIGWVASSRCARVTQLKNTRDTGGSQYCALTFCKKRILISETSLWLQRKNM